MKLSRSLQNLCRRAIAAKRGTVAMVFALLTPVVLLIMVGAIDTSSMVATQTRLQQATDAAALAVSAADSKNPNISETTLKALATSMVAANYSGGSPTITSFSLCTPTQTADCGTNNGNASVTNTVAIKTQVQGACYVPLLLPGICTPTGQTPMINVVNVTNIGFAANIQINLLLDVSGSMIVGATDSDVTKIATWTNNNWSQVHYSGDSNQTVQCAFACHDEGPGNGSTKNTTYGYSGSDMDLGLTNATKAGATTRYAVMTSAAKSLISHIQSEVGTNTQLAKDNYYFNIYSLADSITETYNGTTKPDGSAHAANDYSGATAAVGTLQVGLDTHFNDNAAAFATSVGANGSGASSSAPLKFVILVSDGTESDFYKDFYTCSGSAYDSKWASYIGTGCYAKPFNTAACTTLKGQGVVLAVLETPYIALTGQDPKETLYEAFVRSMIYPNGPNTASTVSTALQSCATAGYYYKTDPSNPADISSGFQALTDKFLASTAYIKS